MVERDNGFIGLKKEETEFERKKKRKTMNIIISAIVLSTIFLSVYVASSISGYDSIRGVQSIQTPSFQSVEISRAPDFTSVDVVTGKTVLVIG